MVKILNKKSFFQLLSNPKFQGIFIFILALICFSWIQVSPTIMDPDSFYHAKMALFIKEGKIIHNFPWLQATTLKDNFVDHHFLYHLFLVPFVSLFDPLGGSKIAQVILASFTIFFVYWFLQKFRVKGAFFYSLLFFTSFSFLFRLNLVKAPALSLIITIIALYLIFEKKSFWLLLLSFFYVWAYSGWFILWLIVAVYLAAETFFLFFEKQNFNIFLKKILNFSFLRNFIFCFLENVSRKNNLKLLLSVLGGTMAGLVINPYFPGNVSFYWIQVFKIGIINLQQTINVGAEWYPTYSTVLFPNNFLIIFLWFFSVGWFLVQIKNQKKESLTLLIISFLFFVLTLKSSRYIEYFIPLAILSASFSLKNLWSFINIKEYAQQIKNLFLPPNGFLTLFASFWIALFIGFFFTQNIYQNTLNLKTSFEKAHPMNYLQGTANYLKNNTPENSIVFNGLWDESPALFYYNDHNYYINGLDQTFMYVYDSNLYYLWDSITKGEIQKIALAKTIKNNFNSSYVAITKREGLEQFRDNLKDNKYFEKLYEDDEAIIYKVNI